MSYAIAASNLYFSYEKTLVLQNVEFQISQGEYIGIIGPNGGGKTTLLRLIMGFLTPQKGSLHVFGQSPTHERRRIGYVPQANQTDRDFPITVLELVMLGCASNHCYYPPYAKEKALAVRMGNMYTVATPYTQTDTIRVVMQPGGNGDVIGFVKDAEGKISSMNYGGFTFTKLAE